MVETDLFRITQSGAPEAPDFLLVQGDRTIGPVEAEMMERQFALDGLGWLLFLTGNPFENWLLILFVSPDERIADRINLSWPYLQGDLAQVSPLSDREVAFEFPSGNRNAVVVERRRAWPAGRERWLKLRRPWIWSMLSAGRRSA